MDHEDQIGFEALDPDAQLWIVPERDFVLQPELLCTVAQPCAEHITTRKEAVIDNEQACSRSIYPQITRIGFHICAICGWLWVELSLSEPGKSGQATALAKVVDLNTSRACRFVETSILLIDYCQLRGQRVNAC